MLGESGADFVYLIIPSEAVKQVKSFSREIPAEQQTQRKLRTLRQLKNISKSPLKGHFYSQALR